MIRNGWKKALLAGCLMVFCCTWGCSSDSDGSYAYPPGGQAEEVKTESSMMLANDIVELSDEADNETKVNSLARKIAERARTLEQRDLDLAASIISVALPAGQVPEARFLAYSIHKIVSDSVLYKTIDPDTNGMDLAGAIIAEVGKALENAGSPWPKAGNGPETVRLAGDVKGQHRGMEQDDLDLAENIINVALPADQVPELNDLALRIHEIVSLSVLYDSLDPNTSGVDLAEDIIDVVLPDDGDERKLTQGEQDDLDLAEDIINVALPADKFPKLNDLALRIHKIVSLSVLYDSLDPDTNGVDLAEDIIDVVMSNSGQEMELTQHEQDDLDLAADIINEVFPEDKTPEMRKLAYRIHEIVSLSVLYDSIDPDTNGVDLAEDIIDVVFPEEGPARTLAYTVTEIVRASI